MQMDYVLNAGPAMFKIKGNTARGVLGAGYTGRQVDVEKGYELAKQWLDTCETSRECPIDFEAHFLTSLASVVETKLVSPLFRGRFFRDPPTSPFEFGPPPATLTRQGRYNKTGEPVLYLCSSETGVLRELAIPTPGSSLWVQRFSFHRTSKSSMGLVFPRTRSQRLSFG